MNQIPEIIKGCSNRFEMWIKIINNFKFETIAEIGVYRGDFASKILKECPSVQKYYMIDPWKNLADWNKPANNDDKTFETYFTETITKTNFAESKRIILRGKTTEVIDDIADNSLDYAYIDGDHTLRGITIDLIKIWPKIKDNGFIGGDDFTPTIWQHAINYEPTLVFPFAVYFSESVNAKIYGLPFNQFLIQKTTGFSFTDLTDNAKYKNSSLLHLIKKPYKKSSVKNKVKKYLPSLYKLLKKIK